MGLSPLSLAFVALGASCMLISGFVLWQEIGEVNRKRPDDQQISYLGIYTEKMAKIRSEYRRLYPSGCVDHVRLAFQIAGFVFLLAAVITMRFFGNWPGR